LDKNLTNKAVKSIAHKQFLIFLASEARKDIKTPVKVNHPILSLKISISKKKEWPPMTLNRSRVKDNKLDQNTNKKGVK
jgi:hypothetical protein